MLSFFNVLMKIMSKSWTMGSSEIIIITKGAILRYVGL